MASTADLSAATTTVKKRRGKMRGRNRILLIIFSMLMMGMLRAGFLFIIIGLLPAIVVYFIDQSVRQYTFKCVFSLNLAAMMSSITKIVAAGPNSTVMQSIMSDGLNWVSIYGAAMLGLLMVSIMSTAAEFVVKAFHQTQVNNLNKNQKRIEEEWGQEVTQFSHPDVVEQ